jgi:hypothetical protein
MTKNEAIDELRKIILEERGSVSADVNLVASVVPPVNPTFADIWLRYRTLKESVWSNASRKAVVSVFETAPRKEGKEYKLRRPSVLQMTWLPTRS